VVYKKATQFQEDKEGLGRLILTDPNEIKNLVTNIDHTNKRGEDQLPQQQQEQDHSHQLNSTINDLVDQFGNTSVKEGEFPQARNNNKYIPATIIDQSQSQSQPRSYPQRVRKPSQRVLDNVIHYNEIPIDNPEIYVNNVFIPIKDEPTTYQEATQRPDSQRWYAAMDKKVKSLLNTDT
jgi:hypothetical protein